MKKIDLGNKCVHCKKDTSFGSGRFVNRHPAEIEEEQTDGSYIILDGYCCPICEEQFEIEMEADSRNVTIETVISDWKNGSRV